MDQKLRFRVLFVLLLVVAFGMRLLNIWRLPWSDEFISLKTLPVDLLQNPFFVKVTTNLPLFFYLLKFWAFVVGLFGGDPTVPIWKLRLLPAIFDVTTLAVVFLFLRKEVDKRAAWLFGLLFAFVPLQVYYSQELRPYTLVQLFIALSLIYFYNYLKAGTRKNLLLFIIFSVLSLLTHYAAYLFLAAEVLYTVILVVTKSHMLGARLTVRNLAISFGLLFVVALSLFALEMQSPSFSKSVINSTTDTKAGTTPAIHITVNDFKGFFSLNSAVRYKEVLVFYYWYGLFNYEVDSPVQFVFKKFIAILLLLALFGAYKKKLLKIDTAFVAVTFLLLTTLLMSLFLENLGFYPFGGRHIMPFSVMLYAALGIGLSWFVEKFKISYAVFALLILTLATYYFCFAFLAGKGFDMLSIHGSIYSMCLRLLK